MFHVMSVRLGILLGSLFYLSACSGESPSVFADLKAAQAGRNGTREVKHLSREVLDFRAVPAVDVRPKQADRPRLAMIKSAHLEFQKKAPRGHNHTLEARDNSRVEPFTAPPSGSGSRISLTSPVRGSHAWTRRTSPTPLFESVGRGHSRSGALTASVADGSGWPRRVASRSAEEKRNSPTPEMSFRHPQNRIDPGVSAPGRRVVVQTPLQAGVPQLLFGQGPVGADRLREAELVAKGDLRMLTTWYNGPDDLAWQRGYQANFVPAAYKQGYALHVVVFSEDAERELETAYGTACGRPYPLSPRFLPDLRQLAEVWAGTAASPPLYFTLFTEFQTYPCSDNAWRPNQQVNNYYKALKDVYRQAQEIIYEAAPNAVVSLGWGGWQSFEGDREIGEGRAMIPFFADLMNDSDFVSVQAMDSQGRNPADIQHMVAAINREAPGKPIMVAHYKPDDKNHETFRSDLKHILSDAYISRLNHLGVFAFSFMDDENQKVDPAFYERFIVPKVRRYSKAP